MISSFPPPAVAFFSHSELNPFSVEGNGNARKRRPGCRTTALDRDRIILFQEETFLHTAPEHNS